MSLRDYFAAAALPGLLAERVDGDDGDVFQRYMQITKGPEFNHPSGAAAVARLAYQLADAMLSARTPSPAKE